MSAPGVVAMHARMPWQVPLAVVLGALVVIAGSPGPAAVAGVALAGIAPELCWTDAREHRLPNRMTLPALAVAALAVAASAATGGPWLVAVAAGAAFGGGMLLLALLGGVGMGDAKLAALIGLASPTALVAVTAPVAGLLLGGIAGVVSLVRRGPHRRIPLGPFLVAGWAAALVLGLAARLA